MGEGDSVLPNDMKKGQGRKDIVAGSPDLSSGVTKSCNCLVCLYTPSNE